MPADGAFAKAISLFDAKDYAGARLAAELALEKSPENPDILALIGISCVRMGAPRDAVDPLKKADSLRPGDLKTVFNCALALESSGSIPEAIECYRRVIGLKPSYAPARNNLALIFNAGGRLSEALAICEEGLRLCPDASELRMTGAMALTSMGRIPEAIREFSAVSASCDGFTMAASDLLMCLLYSEKPSGEEIFKAHLRWAERYERPLLDERPLPPPQLAPIEGRRIRIGYLSPDLRRHSVSFFFEPVLASHDREKFETFCYSDNAREDEISVRLKTLSDAWRDVSRIPDKELAALIRSDRIDILFDLAGHTSRRLRVFAMKPAPLQVSWIGYPSTTGLSSIDCRITDALADPQGSDAFHSERLLRMPSCFLTYAPPSDAPDPTPAPCLKNGFITFGSFNAMPKISPSCVKLWASALLAVPGARLVVKNKSLADAAVRDSLLAAFSEEGVEPDRLRLLHHIPELSSHLAAYGMVDIALDSFPYHGTTTTCEALWMGVPTLSLLGDRHSSRVGLSLMSMVGLSSLACKSPDSFVSTAKGFSADFNTLASLRASLRGAMSASALCDSKSFTMNLEARLLKTLGRQARGR